jgi:hypothetical protein
MTNCVARIHGAAGAIPTQPVRLNKPNPKGPTGEHADDESETQENEAVIMETLSNLQKR